MGEAMLRGLAKAGYPAAKLRAYDPAADKTAALAAQTGLKACATAQEALQGADLVVLATKPQAFAKELLPFLATALAPGQAVLSIAAGVRLETLSKALGAQRAYIRVMPNTPGLIGQGVSAFCLGGSAAADHAALAQTLLQPLGLVVQVEEKDMDAVTALSGSGPAYLFLFMEALQAAGTELGLSPEASFLLASQTLAGAAAMVQKREKSPADLRVAVTSPGGTTAAALKVFEDAGFRGLVAKALTAARDRSVELGKS